MTARTTRITACAALALAALSLTACAGGTPSVVDRPFISPNYSRSLVIGANQYDSTKLEVVGQPFGESRATVAQQTLDAVGQVGLLSTIALTTGDAPPRNPYRLIVQYAPGRYLTHRQVCAGDRATEGENDGRQVRVMLTYCLRDDPIVSLRARKGGINGIDDPAFGRFVRDVATVAFSPRNEGLQKGNGPDIDIP
jgi:hypothetical protein